MPVKSNLKISQNFVAFSEYMNFTAGYLWGYCGGYCGVTLELLWVTLGNFGVAAGLLWGYRGVTMGLPKGYCGVTAGLLKGYSGVTLGIVKLLVFFQSYFTIENFKIRILSILFFVSTVLWSSSTWEILKTDILLFIGQKTWLDNHSPPFDGRHAWWAFALVQSSQHR